MEKKVYVDLQAPRSTETGNVVAEVWVGTKDEHGSNGQVLGHIVAARFLKGDALEAWQGWLKQIGATES